MFRTFINIRDRGELFTYLFSSYLFPITLFSFLRKRPLFPCLSPSLVHLILHGFTLDIWSFKISLLFCLLTVLLWQPLFLCLGKGAFYKGHEACTTHQAGNAFTKSHHFSSLVLAFYNISGVTIMLKGARNECTPFLSFVLERTPCKELGDSMSMSASAIVFTWTGHITLGFSISTCKMCRLVLDVL